MIVIGGGLGGLSTGCYAQMNGYSSTVLEMHEIPGGCCTAWDRGAYTFDPTVSWLLGSGPGNEMHRIWLELGAIQGKRMRTFETFNTVVSRDGRAVRFYSDPDRLQAHLLELSPQDGPLIRRFCAGLRAFRTCLTKYPFLTPVPLMGRRERLRMLARFVPYANMLRRAMSEPMTDFSARFREPLLRDAFNYILYEKHPSFPLLPFWFQLASHANRSAGVPEGGSLALARSVEQRYQRLGGDIVYNAKVTEILVEDDRAVGVRLSDGSERRADIVVSACDGRTTALDLLKGRYLDEGYRTLYTRTVHDTEMVFPGYVTVFLGLRAPFPHGDPCSTYLLDDEQAARLTGIRHPSLNVQFRSRHYPELSPPGTAVVYASYFCDIAPWRALSTGPEQSSRVRRGVETHTLAVGRGRAYQQAKRRVRDTVVEVLERHYPGIGQTVAVRDVSTPLTQVRYTGNHDGTVLGWQPFMASGEAVEEQIRKHGPGLPGLRNFYLSGVWATSGGLIRAAAAGRHVMQYVCRDDGRTFRAAVDESAPSPTQVFEEVGP
ncbi:phytoene desaturase family protein [Streptomyces sp. CBMA29]|uniref:phytoene desaturase family protein n=1 Tax=Streptomyces sp. CBMA29 TaxID=1896314 RepID=UPI0016619F07|nr:NAD(P)/FAD-dependent oxidoreductase [Streptomyces sp. CBMA29]MBD0734541.1 phytoene dehydrogenase [Streptomyces sp. CBMA29]